MTMLRKTGGNWVEGERFFDREVEEVAQDIRRELVKLKEGRTDDRGASAYRR